MRRMVAGFLCLLLVSTAGGSAAANPAAGAEAVRGASATWWRHGADSGTIYFLDVHDRAGTFGNRPTALRAFFGAIPCGVGKRNQPVDCRWRRAEYGRVKVDSFEIDPLMNSAHAVVHRGDRRGELTWTGRGDYSKPFVWQGIGELFVPPYFAHLYASVMAGMGRGARISGDMFGLDLKRSELGGAGMYDVVYGGASACLSGPWCWAQGGRARAK